MDIDPLNDINVIKYFSDVYTVMQASVSDSVRVEIVGAGIVGSATGFAFESWGHDVTYKDPDEGVRERLTADGRHAVTPDRPVDADVSVIAVPTPYDADTDAFDLSFVETAMTTLRETAPSGRVVAVRSTVPPGTIDRLVDAFGFEHVAMIPEFLFAASAQEDARTVEQVIIGTRSDHARGVLADLYAHNQPTVHHVTPTEAELVKLASNAYGATKISFANQIWRISREFDTDDPDADRILDVFRRTCPWIEPHRGLIGGRPYGGACLPKDTKGFYAWLTTHGIPAPQLAGTIDENELMIERDHPEGSYGKW